MRDALQKEKFLEGNRQRWLSVLIAIMLIILFVDKTGNINPEPYLSFLTWIGVAAIGGMTASSWNKEQAAKEALRGHKE